MHMQNQKFKPTRVLSIDIMRGLTLFLMLFVNDLFEAGVPKWLLHTSADYDGMGLADWVFPGFLFMVGMSIPYAFNSRVQKGESKPQIFFHILVRTLSLIIIGLFMLNSGRLNSDLTGINKNVYAILMYLSVFLIWNKYPESEKYRKLFFIMKMAGISGLVFLALIFRAGSPEKVSWFVTSWWGILGQIGWGYFVAATAFLLIGSKLWPTVGLWLFFICLNILSQLGLLSGLDFIKPVFGIILHGNVPFIVLAGLVVSLILRDKSFNHWKIAGIIMLLGCISLASGFIFRNYFIVSKILATPSFGQICNGISMILFVVLYLIIDIFRKSKWTVIFKPAGENSLTTYLAPSVIYHICWAFGLQIFIYKQDYNQYLAVGGSILWAFAMVGFAALLSKVHIRLKL
jgi:heparan-alpha-glucosaminide N-acetyltransferase